MKSKMGRTVIVAVALTVFFAVLTMGYGMWSKTLTVTETVTTGSIDLAFVSTTDPDPLNRSPYTDDDNDVNNSSTDPLDVGWCDIGVGDDDGDNRFDEDPAGDANGDGCPGICGVDDDDDWATDEDGDGYESSSPSFDPAYIDDDDEDGLIDEDPDHSITTSCDPRATSTWSVILQKWVHTPVPRGPDRGIAEVNVIGGNKIREVWLTKPSVRKTGGYSPTVYFEVTNDGTVPIVLTAITTTLPYELWDIDGNGTTTDADTNGDCDHPSGEGADECAPAVDARLTINGGTPQAAIGLEINPGSPVPGILELFMTPATNPGEIYAVFVDIAGHNYNEP